MQKISHIDPLGKMRQLTSNFGIYQHGYLEKPTPAFGYALDDQARALIVANEFGDNRLERIYLNFIQEAIKRKDPYHYFYDEGEKVVPDRKIKCSDDALGMIVWAILKTKNESDIQFVFDRIKEWEYPRAIAYAILGLLEGEEQEIEGFLINKLVSLFREEGEWKWFDNYLTYGNALLPWALWKRSVVRNDKNSMKVAEITTKFLIDNCQDQGVPMPIGCKGWYKKGGIKAKYDQQPVDAAYMICCLEQAYLATNNEYYRNQANSWWRWFWGNNTRGVSLIDQNGGCYDAITDKSDKVNFNQGAESNISFPMAYLAAKRLGLTT